MASDLEIRPIEERDLDAVASIHLRARQAEGSGFPPALRGDDDVRRWVGTWDLDAHDVWVAVVDETVVGYARFTRTWLDDLYVDPASQGRGIGTALLDLVKGLRAEGFGLWVLEANTVARTFYETRGLVALEGTDGTASEDQVPDRRMLWPGAEPLACFRRLIDEVDEQLGDLLARRSALTRAVHEHKQAVHAVQAPPRGGDREAEVARRVAARAPGLGEQRVARIMHAVITESVEAARGGVGR